LWAFFADAIIDRAAQNSPVVRPNTKVNTFLQTREPPLKKLPTHLKRILKAAKNIT
jgi:hypothetical protein